MRIPIEPARLMCKGMEKDGGMQEKKKEFLFCSEIFLNFGGKFVYFLYLCTQMVS